MHSKLTRILAVAVLALVVALPARSADLTVWGIQTFSKQTDELIASTLQAFAKSKGVTAEYVVVPANYLNERLAAAIESGSPPDIFMNVGESVQYYMSLGVTAPVDDVLAEMQQRGIFPAILPMLKYNGVANALPVEIDISPLFCRLDYLRQVGHDVPNSWEEVRQAAIAIKKKGLSQYPLGLSLSNCNDAETNIRVVIWSFGGALFSEDGKKITFDSPETRAAMTFLNKCFRDDKIISRSSLTWDDSGNNTAWQTGRAAFVSNSPSIYSWMAQNDQTMLDNSVMVPCPKGEGPNSRFAGQVSAQSWMVSKVSKQIPLAKDFLRWFYRDENYRALIDSCGGRWIPVFPSLMDDMPLFTKTPQLKNFKAIAESGILNGWRGTSSAVSAEVQVARIVPAVVSKILDGGEPVEKATAWGQAEMEKLMEASQKK